jgi:DNA-binding transcriptional LysR family regulator
LLERGKQGVLPTAYGKVLYDYFKSALESVQRGRQEVEFMRDGSKGHVNIGAPTGMIDLFLPNIIEQMVSKARGITFDIRYGYLDNLLQALRHGEVDFLLTPYWQETLLADDLEIEKMTDINVSIYARGSHPLAQKKNVTLNDLTEADWILAESEGMQAFRQDLFGTAHARHLNCIVTHNHPPFMINMLEKLDLLSIMPDYTVEHLTTHGSLKKVEYPSFRPSLSAGLIQLTGRHITPSMLLFADTTREYMRSVTR